MAGSLIQLSAIGVENSDLTIDASHTFFKSQYQKHTAFALEPKELHFASGHADYGKKGTVKIDRQGDLVTDLWLMVDVDPLAADWRFQNDFGSALIEQVSVSIGAVKYDTRTSEFTHAWNSLSVPSDKRLRKLVGYSESPIELNSWAAEKQRFYIPLKFWFTEAYSSSLPLVGLYQHEVVIDFTFRSLADMTVNYQNPGVTALSGGAITNMSLVAEYCFLSNPERNYFARGTHKYLLNQIQFSGAATIAAGATGYTANIHFNHPTSELIWMLRKDSAESYFDFKGEGVAPFAEHSFASMKLLLNSSERFAARDPLYFNRVVPKRHHSILPGLNSGGDAKVYCYAFGLTPEKVADPSGSINFSRIDNSQMVFTFQAPLGEAHEFFLFAKSKNWMKIERGLSKLFYA